MNRLSRSSSGKVRKMVRDYDNSSDREHLVGGERLSKRSRSADVLEAEAAPPARSSEMKLTGDLEEAEENRVNLRRQNSYRKQVASRRASWDDRRWSGGYSRLSADETTLSTSQRRRDCRLRNSFAGVSSVHELGYNGAQRRTMAGADSLGRLASENDDDVFGEVEVQPEVVLLSTANSMSPGHERANSRLQGRGFVRSMCRLYSGLMGSFKTGGRRQQMPDEDERKQSSPTASFFRSKAVVRPREEDSECSGSGNNVLAKLRRCKSLDTPSRASGSPDAENTRLIKSDQPVRGPSFKRRFRRTLSTPTTRNSATGTGLARRDGDWKYFSSTQNGVSRKSSSTDSSSASKDNELNESRVMNRSTSPEVADMSLQIRPRPIGQSPEEGQKPSPGLDKFCSGLASHTYRLSNGPHSDKTSASRAVVSPSASDTGCDRGESPTGRQSLDSGFSDSGESNCGAELTCGYRGCPGCRYDGHDSTFVEVKQDQLTLSGQCERDQNNNNATSELRRLQSDSFIHGDISAQNRQVRNVNSNGKLSQDVKSSDALRPRSNLKRPEGASGPFMSTPLRRSFRHNSIAEGGVKPFRSNSTAQRPLVGIASPARTPSSHQPIKDLRRRAQEADWKRRRRRQNDPAVGFETGEGPAENAALQSDFNDRADYSDSRSPVLLLRCSQARTPITPANNRRRWTLYQDRRSGGGVNPLDAIGGKPFRASVHSQFLALTERHQRLTPIRDNDDDTNEHGLDSSHSRRTSFDCSPIVGPPGTPKTMERSRTPSSSTCCLTPKSGGGLAAQLSACSNSSSKQSPVLQELHTSTIIETGNTVHDMNTQEGRNQLELNRRPRSREPVRVWWKDLLGTTEPECMTYLHSKPLPGRDQHQLPRPPASFLFTVETTLDSMDTVNKLLRKLDSNFAAMNLVQIEKLVDTLATQIEEFLCENLGSSFHTNSCSLVGGPPDGSDGSFSLETVNLFDLPGLRICESSELNGKSEIILLQQKSLLQTVSRLKLCAERCKYNPQQPLVDLRRILENLEAGFNKLTGLILRRSLKPLIDCLLRGEHDSGRVSEVLNHLIELGGRQSDRLYPVITDLDAVRGLVGLSVGSEWVRIRVLSLRALASVCCNAFAIRKLEECGGVDIVCGLLETGCPLEVKVEAVGVLAQITSPWIQNAGRLPIVSSRIPTLVTSLSRLAKTEYGEDSFLLTSACLANLSFMEAETCGFFMAEKTVNILIAEITKSHAGPSDDQSVSVFALDQVLTVLANMAAYSHDFVNSVVEECAKELTKAPCSEKDISSSVVPFLIKSFSTSLEDANGLPEKDAILRIIKKSAIALSRLCTSYTVFAAINGHGGMTRAVELCSRPDLRNFSDAILLACLGLLKACSRFRSELDAGHGDHEDPEGSCNAQDHEISLQL